LEEELNWKEIRKKKRGYVTRSKKDLHFAKRKREKKRAEKIPG